MKRTQNDTFKRLALNDAGVKKHYDDLEDEFALISELIRARKMKGKSQKEVAMSMKTTPSVVSRLESGFGKQRHSPSLDTLRRYAKALGCHLSIKLVPDFEK